MKAVVCHITIVHPADDIRIFHRECVSLASSGFCVHLVAPADESGVRDGVHIHRIRRVTNRLLRIPLLPWWALIKALGTRAQIYHYHDPELMVIGAVLRWVFRKKVVYDVHESVRRNILYKHWIPRRLRCVTSRIYGVLERVCTLGVDLVVATEFHVAEYDRKVYPVLNFPKLVSGQRNKCTLPRRIDDVPELVYVGCVTRDRGAELYIDLANRLRKDGYTIRMRLVGNCLDEAYAKELHATVADLSLEDVVEFTGRVDHDHAMDIVSTATIGLCLLLPNPNYTRSLATKILEYMMLSVPVLASNFECWEKYVAGAESGLMVDPTDLDDVVCGCKRLLDHPELACKMGESGRMAIEQKYNWNTEFARLLECYQQKLTQG